METAQVGVLDRVSDEVGGLLGSEQGAPGGCFVPCVGGVGHHPLGPAGPPAFGSAVFPGLQPGPGFLGQPTGEPRDAGAGEFPYLFGGVEPHHGPVPVEVPLGGPEAAESGQFHEAVPAHLDHLRAAEGADQLDPLQQRFGEALFASETGDLGMAHHAPPTGTGNGGNMAELYRELEGRPFQSERRPGERLGKDGRPSAARRASRPTDTPGPRPAPQALPYRHDDLPVALRPSIDHRQ
ncbi:MULTISPECIES: hypothetical protein [Streptomycetaceae]|uniref:hypothetical protein n=1 Tax=Streptomyces sp. SID5468 TaxID=2690295 RepID=UPI0012FFBB83|nr:MULTISPECIES: hypothetical protein [Streptomycetaceae]MYS57967.1 hypothetical protein [Streptomyces sp. SID5468]